MSVVLLTAHCIDNEKNKNIIRINQIFYAGLCRFKINRLCCTSFSKTINATENSNPHVSYWVICPERVSQTAETVLTHNMTDIEYQIYIFPGLKHNTN